MDSLITLGIRGFQGIIMRPKSLTNHQEDLFKSHLSNQLNPKHELFRLAALIPWNQLETEFASIFDDKKGHRQVNSIFLYLLQYMVSHFIKRN